MPIGFSDLLSAMQNGVQAMRSLNTTLGKVFPQATATSSITPAAGALTFSSSQPAGFLSVVTSSGGTYKVALY